MEEDKRISDRVPLATIALITRKDGQSCHGAIVRDICAHGIGIYTNRVYKTGDRVLIELTLPTEREGVRRESIPAEVAWVEPLPGTDQYVVGMRFGPIHDEKSKLSEYIHYVERSLSHKSIDFV